jgi:hypothetical protein
MVLDHHLVPEVITPALCVAVAGRLADVDNEGPGIQRVRPVRRLKRITESGGAEADA